MGVSPGTFRETGSEKEMSRCQIQARRDVERWAGSFSECFPREAGTGPVVDDAPAGWHLFCSGTGVGGRVPVLPGVVDRLFLV